MGLSGQAENIDFDTDGLSIADEMRFRFFKPWVISIDHIRNYLGEKIAIYFYFLSNYTK